MIQNYLNVQLADCSDSKENIVVLIGADYYYNVVEGRIKRLKEQLVATKTIFGWCIIGKDDVFNGTSLSFNIIVEENLVSNIVKKFWDLESLGIIDNEPPNPTNDNVLKKFESEIEYENSRYKVKLPWKDEKRFNLSDNKKIAEQRFSRLKKRFHRNPDLYLSYQAVLQDYLQQNIIEKVSDSCDTGQITFYLPHREVVRNDRTSSKFRVVFDASSHDIGELSLNDCLHIGPNLYPDIFELLLQFRLHPIVFTADIRQAFLQIEVDESDRDVSRFLFTDNPADDSEPPQVYRFTRVLFGVNSSPFMLGATIKYHIKKYQQLYPETCEFLNNFVYVDDIIGGHKDVKSAYKTSIECIKIFKGASMVLHKWKTNNDELHKLWVEEGIITEESSEILEAEKLPFKVLGISWDKKEDTLYFDVQNLLTFLSNPISTKRYILQAVGRVFDPVGFLSPFVLRIKCLMQEIWKLHLDWDDCLPGNINLDWKKWCEEVHELCELKVPRYYFSNPSDVNVKQIELHLFSDASQKAYATSAYLRILSQDGSVRTVFVGSKSRVAPLKKLTLPRLELMGALLSARFSDRITKALKLNFVYHFWTDSQITLFWIKGTPKRFKPFVKNRTEEINKLTSSDNWHFCPGKSNPADLASRGASVLELKRNPIWFNGPEWLLLTPEFWPKQNSTTNKDIDNSELEFRKSVTDVIQFKCVVTEKLLSPTNYSNLRRLYRVTAWTKRFLKKIRKIDDTKGPLTADELEEAETYWIQEEQKEHYLEEIESLKEKGQVQKNSKLYKFNPLLDNKGILRIKSRLEHSEFSIDEKHPIILPRNSFLTNLIVQSEHINMKHGGTATTLAKIRNRFWIPKGRQVVQKNIRRCLICKKYSAKPADQITSQLPEDRIAQTPPFRTCGVDYAGPVYVKGLHDTQRSYIILFTCATTRALHLELAPNMNT